MPKVTAVIPNYNHARFLRRRVESVLGQTWQDLEVVLMDDCSTDGSRAIIAEFASDPRVRVVLNEQNSGSTFKQWNKGVRHATGDYIWLAESDDLAEPTLLERVVSAMEADRCGVGCCESWLLRGDGEPNGENLEPHFRPPPRTDFWTRDFACDGRTICMEDMLRGNALPNASAVVFRRDLFERVGGADETMRQAGDRMMWLKMLSVSDLAHVGDRLNYFRFHGDSVRSKRESSARTITEVYRAIRFARDTMEIPEEKLDAALVRTAAYFAKASARRGVAVNAMAGACREIADVDPRIWRRLFAPFLLRRTVGPPIDVLRQTKRAVTRRVKGVGG